jgi:hypothetical protein
MEQQIYDALTAGAEAICEAKCPAVFKTGQPQPHSDECKKARAALVLIASGKIRERCTICGFIVDTSFKAEKPTADFTTAGRAKRAQPDAAPEGWKLVPLIPDQDMLEVGCDSNPTQWNPGTDLGFAAEVANDVYVSMVRAAPRRWTEA